MCHEDEKKWASTDASRTIKWSELVTIIVNAASMFRRPSLRPYREITEVTVMVDKPIFDGPGDGEWRSERRLKKYRKVRSKRLLLPEQDGPDDPDRRQGPARNAEGQRTTFIAEGEEMQTLDWLDWRSFFIGLALNPRLRPRRGPALWQTWWEWRAEERDRQEAGLVVEEEEEDEGEHMSLHDMATLEAMGLRFYTSTIFSNNTGGQKIVLRFHTQQCLTMMQLKFKLDARLVSLYFISFHFISFHVLVLASKSSPYGVRA